MKQTTLIYLFVRISNMPIAPSIQTSRKKLLPQSPSRCFSFFILFSENFFEKVTNFRLIQQKM